MLSIQQALAAGFTPDRLLCLRPPFSREFNRAILREYRAEVLVTKASGLEGGVEEKVLAAGDLGIEVVMIRRPEQEGVIGVASLEELRCRRVATDASWEGDAMTASRGEPALGVHHGGMRGRRVQGRAAAP